MNFIKQKATALTADKNKRPGAKADKQQVAFIEGNPLTDAEEKLSANDAAAFYSSLNFYLRKYLSAKLDIPIEELSKKKINERLDKCNVTVGTSLLLTTVLENIEINLYAPVSSADEMKEDYEKASEFVSLLNKQVC